MKWLCVEVLLPASAIGTGGGTDTGTMLTNGSGSGFLIGLRLGDLTRCVLTAALLMPTGLSLSLSLLLGLLVLVLAVLSGNYRNRLEWQTGLIERLNDLELLALNGPALGDQHGQHDVLDVLTVQGLARHGDFVLQDFRDSDFHGLGSPIGDPLIRPCAIDAHDQTAKEKAFAGIFKDDQKVLGFKWCWC
ncbi:hypothetical protein [Pseudomonas aeruginosa]|uniref:hypothetical protein n=1 Tax=Pseudomonas aeruginosa TaxID=287 RepID=UPI00157F9BBC|nr:hypothetical protein [Pseudomonas aeruginosa]EKW7235061.1 hypothetical protein [Pseudomonas aeruginosa]MBI8828845.1 hypothetical protein [Pseudomonas aeruginosa]QKR09266.1 hypothetical protein HB744_12120 [Pseudomonas aeruginosa]